MTDSVTGIGHIALRVTDLPRAKRFYTESLGFPLAGKRHGRASSGSAGRPSS